MDVQNPALETLDEPWAQDAHETCEYYQVAMPGGKLFRDCPVERLAVRETRMRQANRFDTGPGRAFEPIGVATIRQDEDDIEVEVLIRYGIDHRLQIAAGSGYQDRRPAATGIDGARLQR